MTRLNNIDLNFAAAQKAAQEQADKVFTDALGKPLQQERALLSLCESLDYPRISFFNTDKILDNGFRLQAREELDPNTHAIASLKERALGGKVRLVRRIGYDLELDQDGLKPGHALTLIEDVLQEIRSVAHDVPGQYERQTLIAEKFVAVEDMLLAAVARGTDKEKAESVKLVASIDQYLTQTATYLEERAQHFQKQSNSVNASRQAMKQISSTHQPAQQTEAPAEQKAQEKSLG